MLHVNITNSIFSTFLVTGIPGLEAVYIWIAIPFCAMFLITMVGNMTIIIVIWHEQTLHVPMYLFLAMLASSDLGLSLFTFPTLLRIFLLNDRELTTTACFTQMFFIHGASVVRSALLVAMAFDRFVAICHPLNYTVIMNPHFCCFLVLMCWIIILSVSLFHSLLMKQLTFSMGTEIPHFFCELTQTGQQGESQFSKEV